MASCWNHYSGFFGHSRNVMKSVFMSGDKIYITWARCGVASLVGATHCPCSEPSEV